MHGQFQSYLDEKLEDIEHSYRWVKYGYIKGETESTIMAAQHQATSINYFDVLLTVHLSIFILVINQLDAQNFVHQVG